MLDLGANPECTPEILAEFALMGSVLSKSVEGNHNPSVGLLNIGSFLYEEFSDIKLSFFTSSSERCVAAIINLIN